jgi:phage tail sheath protein FI
MASRTKTPGIYINKLNSFPDSIAPVATAVPAFIGYTPRAEYNGESYYNRPVKIGSFTDFKAFFMLENPPAPAAPAKQYNPQYYLVERKARPEAGDYVTVAGQYYSILPDPNTVYYLYNSIRLFYQNGGGDAYIVSVGGYGPPGGKPQKNPRDQIINSNVRLADLLKGLALLRNENQPTLCICPEATLLPPADNAALMQAMLRQAGETRTAMCLFDIIGGRNPDPVLYTGDIQNFRNDVGDTGLNFGAAYYPFLCTTITQHEEIDFTNFFGGDPARLEPLLNPPEAPNPKAAALLKTIASLPVPPLTNRQLQAALLDASPVYTNIVSTVLASTNILPPSGAMAGVYTMNDNTYGVWQAPANVTIDDAVDLTIRLVDDQQANLNVDAISGKSINAIRFFNGQGILVWGARTLDGNSQDWRYVNVRRTATFLEQSIKQAMQAYEFAPNDANTWVAIAGMTNNFLMSVWQQGGLQGAMPSDAFQVNIGLGNTMTSDDILNGILRIDVLIAITHPAEFIEMTIEQQQTQP